MPKYQYVARDRSNRTVNSDMIASSQQEVILNLQKKNLVPVTITEVSSRKTSGMYEKINESLLSMQKGVPVKDIVFFTRQMTTFINAGVSLTKSINNIGHSQKNIVFRRILNDVYEDINAGSDFSSALAKHPTAFDQMYVNIIKAGEATGQLEKSLDSLAIYMEKSAAMKQAIKSAMMYPKFVMGFTVLIVIGIIKFIIPVFEDMYGGMGAELPAPTAFLIFLSGLFESNLLEIIGIIILLVILKKFAFKTKIVNNMWDKFTINVPTFGSLVQQIIITKVTSTLSLMMSSGTPIIQCLNIAGKVSNNNEYETAMEKAIVDVKNGVELSVALKRTNRWPDIMIQLIETGEETGKIDELMQKVADYFDEEVQVKIKGFASLIEPLLIVVMGVVIGGIVIAIYLPMFGMGDVMRG